jgi:vacuolar protein sorting-associated protein 13A/C
MAVSKAYRHVQKPLKFDLLWCSSGDVAHQQGDEANRRLSSEDLGRCWCVWAPVAPPGYVALGCIAERGMSPPPLSFVHCIRSDLVTSASMSDCLFYLPPDAR